MEARGAVLTEPSPHRSRKAEERGGALPNSPLKNQVAQGCADVRLLGGHLFRVTGADSAPVDRHSQGTEVPSVILGRCR